MASSARIDELRKKFEENPRRYFAPLANEYRKAGQVDQAIAICREYLPQQPGHMSGHIVYGQALYEARQFEEAKGVFETALSLDPENLIALRHLGDIALLIGDSDAARTWYRRVLEADPRNEEIQAQLLTLEQASTTPASAPTADATSASSAPTVVVDARQAADSSGSPRPSEEVRRQPWARKTPVPMHAPTTGQLTPASKTLEAVPRPAGHVDAHPASSLPTPESVPAIELQLPVAGSAANTPASVLIETAAVAGLETTSLTGSAPVAPPSLPAPSEAAKGGAVPPRLSLRDVPVAESTPLPPESGPFVTETMAELYLQQGHQEEALRVYRALLEQRPGDAALEGRIAALEGDVAKTEPMPSGSPTPAGMPSVSAGPTIREVLELIAQRRPGFRAAPLRGRGNGGAPPPAQRTGSVPGARDALSNLFSAARVASADEGAALVLALAFTEVNNGTPARAPLEGAPAHRASNELSLDTVFGGGQGPSGGSVSYDQFFAQRPSGAPATGGQHDDVAQFTKWLEGLKRR
jgi:tetratricopeptide (TPR) repeat protein